MIKAKKIRKTRLARTSDSVKHTKPTGKKSASKPVAKVKSRNTKAAKK